MKQMVKILLLAGLLTTIGCKQNEATSNDSSTETSTVDLSVGQEGVVDETSNPNIVQVASGSADHSTLVTAVKAAGLVTSLSNAGHSLFLRPRMRLLINCLLEL